MILLDLLPFIRPRDSIPLLELKSINVYAVISSASVSVSLRGMPVVVS
jgi:hypothetical protein